MASSYPAYAPQEPSSNSYYANLNHAGRYPPNRSAASLDSDSSGEHDKGGAVKEAASLSGHSRPVVDFRGIARTPSPTPSEAKELAKKGVFDWKAMMKLSYWFRKEWIWYYVIGLVCLVGVILFTVYHKNIVNWLRPAADWMHDLPFGWTIPIGVLFVISFPPLFGHEIVAILCGLVWGLGIGFGIVAAGTFLGELGNFYAFKYCCAARGEKLERTKISYACLARVVREGGFRIALIARLSAIPGHFTTAVFSTCGMGVWTFSIAAILSLPKQFLTVYLGVALEQSEDGGGSKTDTIIKDVVLGATTVITIGAMWYIYNEMNKVKVQVIYDRRKARQAKMGLPSAPALPYGNGNPAVLDSTTSVVFNPAASDSEIPLTGMKYGQPTYAVYAPQPHRPAPAPGMSERGYGYGYGNGNGSGAALPPGAGYAYPAPTSQIPMQRISDPFSDSARIQQQREQRQQEQQQQQAGVSYQRQAPPRGYDSPPPDTFANRQAPRYYQTPQAQQQQPALPSQQAQVQRLASPPPGPGRASAPQTPTQRTYAATSPAPPLPSTANPFQDPMPNPYDTGHGHEVEASDATFYTAAGGHSRGVTEDATYESESGPAHTVAGSDSAHAPPSYSSFPR